MDKNMFCFQCEQTIGCSGCTGNSGVCGKTADTAKLQDELTGALIGLARAVDSTTAVSKKTSQVIIEGLFTTVTNVNFDNASIESMIQKVRAEKERLAPDCRKCQSPCGKTDEYDMQQLWNADEDTRSLKSLILFGIRGMAAYAYHAAVLGHEDDEVNLFFCEALFKIGYEENTETLLSTVLKVGEINLKCMALLDKANTETYGTPEPTEVTLTVEKGPFIVVTGHDLKDLQLLLEQTSGKGINIYTHGEMLPAHAYPFLKKFPHLKGNFGTAWQNQQKEFDHLPAPILYTTNCLMPPKSSYADRVFTTEVVAFPGTVHIDEKKDFTPVIEKALELGGYKEDQILTGINGGTKVTTGFGHAAILSHADTVIKAVKSGDISHFFLGLAVSSALSLALSSGFLDPKDAARRPAVLKVLEGLEPQTEMRAAVSDSPGRKACSPLKTKPEWTSSERITTSWAAQISTKRFSSSAENTRPVGLCGLQSRKREQSGSAARRSKSSKSTS